MCDFKKFVNSKKQITINEFVHYDICMYEVDELKESFNNVFIYNIYSESNNCYILECIDGGFTFDDFTTFTSLEKCEVKLYEFLIESLYIYNENC